MRGCPIHKVLSLTELPSSTWYQRSKIKKPDARKYNKGRRNSEFIITTNGDKIRNEDVKTILKDYRNKNIFFSNAGGYRKLSHYLKRNENIIINHKKCYRLCEEAGILLPYHKKKKVKRTISINRIITKPNVVWEFDIKYIYIQGEKKFAFLLVYIDVFSRMIMHHYLGLRCQSHNLVATLSFALVKHGLNDIRFVVRSDNGPQMTSKEFANYLKTLESKIIHEFIPCATPNKDAHVESFYSIIEAEFVQVHYFAKFVELYTLLEKFITFYNEQRIHGSLRYMTPSEIAAVYKVGGVINGIKPVRI